MWTSINNDSGINVNRRGFLRTVGLTWAVLLGTSALAEGIVSKPDAMSVQEKPNVAPNLSELKNITLFISLMQRSGYTEELNFSDVKDNAMKLWQKIHISDVIAPLGGWAFFWAAVAGTTTNKIGSLPVLKAIGIGSAVGALWAAASIGYNKLREKIDMEIYQLGMDTKYISSRFSVGKKIFSKTELDLELVRLKWI